MTMSHTPGPWVTADYGDPEIFSAEDKMIASARYGLNGISKVQAIANARLIAAAPDLLAALEVMVKAFNTYAPENEGSEYNCVIAARAAIAKATGGTL